MPDDEIVGIVEQIMTEAGIGYYDVACAAGVSPVTMRSVVQTRRLPERSDPRSKIIRFADRNRGVQRRSDVRFV